jgi:hypothetical protein
MGKVYLFIFFKRDKIKLESQFFLGQSEYKGLFPLKRCLGDDIFGGFGLIVVSEQTINRVIGQGSGQLRFPQRNDEFLLHRIL